MPFDISHQKPAESYNHIYILAFANKVPVLLTCPFSHARAACYRDLSVWDSAIVFLLHATRDARCALRDTQAAHSQRRHVSFMYSRASRSFSRFALAWDGCAAPIARCALADSHNLCRLPQWAFVLHGSRSVQPFGLQRWICSLTVIRRYSKQPSRCERTE
jgi:hypothetical protein